MNVPAGTDAFMSMNVVAFMALMLWYVMREGAVLMINECKGVINLNTTVPVIEWACNTCIY